MDPQVEAQEQVVGIEAVLLHKSQHLRWYHLEDPSSPVLDRLAQEFSFHELEIEDCRHQRHTAKLEEYENHLFVIANRITSLSLPTAFISCRKPAGCGSGRLLFSSGPTFW
jgi:Mg2+ and Co2+ transporter CorA